MLHKRLIVVGFLSLFGMIAHAQDTAGTAAATDTAKVAATASVPNADTSHCLTETGSNIKPASGNCLRVNGRVYTREDMGRTGQTTIGGALNELDPSITR